MAREENVFALPFRFCLSSWKIHTWKSGKLEREEKTNCTSDYLSPDDLTRPCELFMRELHFSKELNMKRSENDKVSLRK